MIDVKIPKNCFYPSKLAVRVDKMDDGTLQEKKRNETDHNRSIARWTRAVAIFTLLLAAVSAFSDYCIWQQGILASEAQKDTREQLRALLTQYGENVTIVWDKDHKVAALLFTARFQNVGATRTAWFHGWISSHYYDGSSIPNNIDYTKPFAPVEQAKVIIPANSQFDLGSVAIPGEDAGKILSRQGIGFVWGHIEYADIFEPTISRPINFCILVTMADAPPTPVNAQQIPPENLLHFTPYKPECNTNGQ